jgi:hypothetical protein
LFCIADAIVTTESLNPKGGSRMITVKLKEGKSYKICNQCQYETTSVNNMLSHLNEHRLEELIELKTKTQIDRYGGMKK